MEEQKSKEDPQFEEYFPELTKVMYDYAREAKVTEF